MIHGKRSPLLRSAVSFFCRPRNNIHPYLSASFNIVDASWTNLLVCSARALVSCRSFMSLQHPRFRPNSARYICSAIFSSVRALIRFCHCMSLHNRIARRTEFVNVLLGPQALQYTAQMERFAEEDGPVPLEGMLSPALPRL